VLTIAGSDSGGGAGIQADIKTFMALGLYGSSVICALTAQNGEGVKGIFPVSPEFVKQQLETVLEGFPVQALKTGMLFSSEIIRTVAACLAVHSLAVVVDPVCVSQSGHRLLEEDAVAAIKKISCPSCPGAYAKQARG
jgi:Hydroxymethylpyrimidine/phosphomethylpyrimidine kinase